MYCCPNMTLQWITTSFVLSELNVTVAAIAHCALLVPFTALHRLTLQCNVAVTYKVNSKASVIFKTCYRKDHLVLRALYLIVRVFLQIQKYLSCNTDFKHMAQSYTYMLVLFKVFQEKKKKKWISGLDWCYTMVTIVISHLAHQCTTWFSACLSPVFTTFYSFREQQISIRMTFLSDSCAGYLGTKAVPEHTATVSVQVIGDEGSGDT